MAPVADAREQALKDWLATRREPMIALLEELVNIDSGSYDKAGVDACGEVLKRFFTEAGLVVETLPVADFGDVIRARLPNPAANDQRPIVLLGHRDTVFPKGEVARRPFAIRDGRGYGPGVMDMKGGLVQNAFVLAAFAALGGCPAPLTAFVTSDEEIASPATGPLIAEEARGARAVFNSEPSKPGHLVVHGRKGGVTMICEVFGKAAHSGAHPERGASAVHEIALKIPQFNALTDKARGITVNVGLVSGGQSSNTIPPYARCEIDMRHLTAAEREEAVAAVKAICERCTIPGTSGQFSIKGSFLPLEESEGGRMLLELYKKAAAVAGFEAGSEFTGSCADSGTTASVGCPTLCSVGPVGDHGHTADEWVDLDSLVPCTQALAIAVLRLAEGRLD